MTLPTVHRFAPTCPQMRRCSPRFSRRPFMVLTGRRTIPPIRREGPGQRRRMMQNAFGEKLRGRNLTLIAAIDGRTLRFSATAHGEPDGRDALMCIPIAPGWGSARRCSMRWKSSPGHAGPKSFPSDASEDGFALLSRKHWLYARAAQHRWMRNGEFLSNTTMTKRLGSEPSRKVTFMSERLYLFDTTLRDGAQTTGIGLLPRRQDRHLQPARPDRHRITSRAVIPAPTPSTRNSSRKSAPARRRLPPSA